MSPTRLTGRAKQESALSDRPAVITGIENEPDMPTTLLRPPCYLEVLIPARNEARRLSQTLISTVRYLEAQPYSSSVVVIDNGSVDQTSDLVARKWSDRVAGSPHWLRAARERGRGAPRAPDLARPSFVGYMDADLATPIETLDIVVPLLSESAGRRRVAPRPGGRARQAAACAPHHRRHWSSGPVASMVAARASPILSAGSSSSPATWPALVARRTAHRRIRVRRRAAPGRQQHGSCCSRKSLSLVGRGRIDPARSSTARAPPWMCSVWRVEDRPDVSTRAARGTAHPVPELARPGESSGRRGRGIRGADRAQVFQRRRPASPCSRPSTRTHRHTTGRTATWSSGRAAASACTGPRPAT